MRKFLWIVLLIVLVAACRNNGESGNNESESGSATQGETISEQISPTNTPEPTATATSLPPTSTPQPYETPEHIFPATTRTVHVIQRGDTLTKIAYQYGVTIDAISDANRHFNFDLIIAGDHLYIPACEP